MLLSKRLCLIALVMSLGLLSASAAEKADKGGKKFLPDGPAAISESGAAPAISSAPSWTLQQSQPTAKRGLSVKPMPDGKIQFESAIGAEQPAAFAAAQLADLVKYVEMATGEGIVESGQKETEYGYKLSVIIQQPAGKSLMALQVPALKRMFVKRNCMRNSLVHFELDGVAYADLKPEERQQLRVVGCVIAAWCHYLPLDAEAVGTKIPSVEEKTDAKGLAKIEFVFKNEDVAAAQYRRQAVSFQQMLQLWQQYQSPTAAIEAVAIPSGG